MKAKKILMLVGDYVEDYEAMVPFQILTMVGHTVHVVCPDKKAGEYVVTAIHDFEDNQTYSEKRGHNFRLNETFEEILIDDYDGLLIPGGRAPEYLRLNSKVIEITQYFAKQNKPIASICHGPQILVSADVLAGKTCIAYPTVQPDMVRVGANIGYINDDFSNAVVDGNLVTAAAWPAHPEWMKKFLDLLGTKIEL